MTTTENVTDGLIPADVLASQTAVAVYGLARIKPGREEQFRELVASVIPQVRAEAGYEQYAVHAANAEPGAFAFYERWESGAALLAHVQQPFMQAYFAQLPDLLAADLEAHWLTPVGA
ncbi:putative quinol monooxygenase [Actinoplanes missouriensis]|uniref:putative quinol monooxygenase n=1 Tax=Actinoplanes missouriensis TaxID=1866 RepID=UPI0033F9306D